MNERVALIVWWRSIHQRRAEKPKRRDIIKEEWINRVADVPSTKVNQATGRHSQGEVIHYCPVDPDVSLIVNTARKMPWDRFSRRRESAIEIMAQGLHLKVIRQVRDPARREIPISEQRKSTVIQM